MKFLFFLILICFFLSFCKKENAEENFVVVSDFILAESYFQNVILLVDAEAKQNPELYRLTTSHCLETSVDQAFPDTSYPKTLLMDFSPVNCTGEDGRRRRGIIATSFSDPLSIAGAKAKISFDDFYINDNRLTGTAELRNDGGVTPAYTITVNALIITSNGRQISFSFNGSRKWISGFDTGNPFDDVFEITGSCNGNSSDGKTFSASITSPLIISHDCRSISSGMHQVTLSESAGNLTYGTGECDDVATMFIGKRAYLFHLP